jgi:hypothetical protein
MKADPAHERPNEMNAAQMERLEQEIRDQRGRILTDLSNRKYHPTFGVTKTGLRTDLHRLEGMLMAHAILAGETDWHGVRLVAHSARLLDIQLEELAASIAAA